jgi:hypothetical protein
MMHRWNSNIIDFLGEYEAICQTALGFRRGCLMKKTEGRKSSDTVPYSNFEMTWFDDTTFKKTFETVSTYKEKKPAA